MNESNKINETAQKNLASVIFKSLPTDAPPPKPPRTFKYVPRSFLEDTPDGSKW